MTAPARPRNDYGTRVMCRFGLTTSVRLRLGNAVLQVRRGTQGRAGSGSRLARLRVGRVQASVRAEVEVETAHHRWLTCESGVLSVIAVVRWWIDAEAEVVEFALRLAGELAAEQWPTVGVCVGAFRLFGERFFPASVERGDPEGEADGERDARRPPRAETRRVDE